MSNDNFESSDFSYLIESRWKVIEQTRNKILKDKNFQILKEYYLKNFLLGRASYKDVFMLCISESDLLNIELDKVEESLISDITNTLKSHTYITLKNDFKIVEYSNLKFDETQKVREHLIEVSKQGNCIFLFGEKGITTFIQGHETGENIFLTTQDLLNYTQKFEIEDIKKAIEKYKNLFLTRDHIYSKFFESKNVIISIFGEPTTSSYKSNKNLLKNSPEKYFRNDLIDFLNENVQATFNSEMELLSSRKPIDIHTEKKGKLYFFEIKWLGACKHADKNEVADYSYEGSRADYRANQGVIQTLEYIEEVVEKMNRDLQCGYLIIFDARNNRERLSYADFSSIPCNLQKYYRDKFDKIDDLVVDNIHPAY